MKGKGLLILAVILLLMIGIGLYAYFSNKNKNSEHSSNNNPVNGNNVNPTNNSNGNTTPPNVPHVPSISDYAGKWMVAPYDGVKIYYNYDLAEAKSFNKGETIGWLGKEETGNWICPNRKGYYKVWNSGVTDANCDMIISDAAVKLIFGIK